MGSTTLKDDTEEHQPMGTANSRPSSGEPSVATASAGTSPTAPSGGATTLPPDLLPLATWGTRFTSGVVTAVFTLMVVGIGCVIGWMSRASDSREDVLAAIQWPGIVAGCIWLLMVLALLAGSAATPGQWVLGVGTVDRTTGRPAGGRAVLKEALLVVLGIITVGVAPLVMLLWRSPLTRENQFDRLAGTLVVQRRGAGVPTEGAGFMAGLLHTQAQARVAPPVPTASTAASTPVRAPASPPDLTAVPVAATPTTAPPAAGQAAPAATPVRTQLVLDQGTRLPLDRAWVLGRNPVPQQSHPDAQPFLVPDLDKTLSKSHVVVVPAGDGVEVTDLYSTNGVSVTLPNGAVQPVGPGRTLRAPVGSTITWGARTMEVRAC